MDFLAEFMGFDHYMPPFATAVAGKYLTVSIMHLVEQGDRISMDRQLENHKTIVLRIIKMLGNRKSAMEYLSKYIYAVAIGSNDYFDNYFIPLIYPTDQGLFTPSQYARILVQQLSRQLKTLHRYGARKVAVYGQEMPRCTLFKLVICASNLTSCTAYMTNTIQLFNDGVKTMVAGLDHNLADADLIFINFSGITSSIIVSQGLSLDINIPCCQVSGPGSVIPVNCHRNGKACNNRSQYAYFDLVHPSEAFYELQTRRIYRAQSPTDSYPFDIEHLAQL